MREKVLSMLLRFVLTNGKLPRAVVVNPFWAQTIQSMLIVCDIDVLVRSDETMFLNDCKIVPK